MKFQFLPENFSRSENAPPFETRKIRQFEVERIFLENKKMVDDLNPAFMPERGEKQPEKVERTRKKRRPSKESRRLIVS